jgi:hypothetical protein
MLWLISIVFAILAILGLKLLLPISRKRWRQVRFIRETLGGAGRSEDRRVIVSLSTVPDRIKNLRPTIRSLLRQTRPPDEIVLAIPEFSVREQCPYLVPEYIVQEERTAERGNKLIMVVDDDGFIHAMRLNRIFITMRNCRMRRCVFVRGDAAEHGQDDLRE